MKHYLGLCLVLLSLTAATLLLMRACTATVHDSVAEVAAAFAEVLNLRPQITMNQTVVLTQTAPIAELAVVTKEELVHIDMNEHLQVLSMELPLTEKRLSAEGVYRLKAGFDLTQPFAVAIDPRTNTVVASMPRAKILSVELVGQMKLDSENGWLNRINPDEQAEVVNDLTMSARGAAENSDLKNEAEEQVRARLNELLRRNGQTFLIHWSGVEKTAK